ncbi:MAG TPA: hypothetical protein ENJ45_06310 [Phaeodactylibacter sp.]|nr:hypothetical protein [Phaeodactylibacter sp.]
MLSCALPVFLLMLGAAALGSLLAWLWVRKTIVDQSDEVVSLQNEQLHLQEEIDRLLELTKNFHSERKKLTFENEKFSERIYALQNALQKITRDKTFLLEQVDKLQVELEELRNLSQPQHPQQEDMAESSTDEPPLNIQIFEQQLQDVQEELLQWKAKYDALRNALSKKEKKLIEMDELIQKDKAKSKSKKWEAKYKKLKLKLLAVSKERDDALSQIQQLKIVNERLLSQLLDAKATVQSTMPLENNKQEVFQRIENSKQLLDFDRIGSSSPEAKDDLKKINGVGPFIEKKLNALGIYKFEQIAKLNDQDIQKIIKIIEVPPGIIKGAEWIKQAKHILE